jgi:hypothetical protein
MDQRLFLILNVRIILNVFTGQGVPTGRVYENNIYVIKDFVVKFTNKSSESLLGLLSNRNYLQADSIIQKHHKHSG